MDSTLYVMGSQMDSLTQSLQECSTNLANVDTPGFKRLVNKFRAEYETQPATGYGGSFSDGVSARWPTLVTGTMDLSQGAIRVTGRDLDVAIQGKGFLVVDTPAGERYTRKGRLYVSVDGELTDGFSNPLVAAGGTLRIPANAANVSIGRNGEVVADNVALGQLLMVEVPQLDKLVRDGHCLLRNTGEPAKEAVNTTLVQGALEVSNVEPFREMVNLVDIMRYYEVSAKVMKRIDSLKDGLIQAAG